MEKWDSNLNYEREKAVKQAWKEERQLELESPGSGTRKWTEDERKELIRTGKVKGYEGHHENSVAYSPELAGVSDNIGFYKAGNKEHFADKHGGCTKNPTYGSLYNRKRR